MGGGAISDGNGITLTGNRLARQIRRGAFCSFLGDARCIGGHLLNERVTLQGLRVNQLAAHNTTLGQILPNGHRVNIVQIVVFFLGIEAIFLDKLGDPALYLGPG